MVDVSGQTRGTVLLEIPLRVISLIAHNLSRVSRVLRTATEGAAGIRVTAGVRLTSAPQTVFPHDRLEETSTVMKL